MDFNKLTKLNQEKQDKTNSQVQETKRELANLRSQEINVKAIQSLAKFIEGHTSKSVVLNQPRDYARSEDVSKLEKPLADLLEQLKTHENVDVSPLVEVLQDAVKELKSIPKDHPKVDFPEQIDYTKHLKELQKQTKDVAEAIKSQEMVVEAPNVSVEAPNVQVDAPNLEPLAEKLEKSFKKAVKALKMPEYKTDNSKVEKILEKHTKLLKDIRDEAGKGGSSGGGGMMSLQAKDATGVMRSLTAVESSDQPGTYGIMSLNASGSTASPGSLVSELYDTVEIATPTTTTEVYTYKEGGTGGTTVATVTITYTDATKNQVLSMVKV